MSTPASAGFDVTRLRLDEAFDLPKRLKTQDVGYDLTVSRTVAVRGRTKILLPHNLAVALPPGYFALLLPRSSCMYTKGLICHPGTIDNGYRGEVQTLVWNPTEREIHVQEGERLSQLVLLPLLSFEPQVVKALRGGDRPKGFGSTGGVLSPRGVR